MNKVLVVEDDPNIIELINIHMVDLGCEVHKALNGKEGYELALNNTFDLIVLDLMLPEMDGISICQKLRALEVHTPILMLTAKSEEFDKVLGLESGADDYLTKPFGVREFIARVKAILRRQKRNEEQAKPVEKELSLGALLIHLEKRKVSLDGERVALTPKEFELLVVLAQNPGRSYDRDQLLSLVWGYDFSGYEHTVNSHINRLRAKIEPDISNPQYILTTWGVGYRFNDEL
ncbi:MAG: DNA-binding response regulator [Crocinitomicaceae bacterium]|nr:DNA-binding response regulator [Crocinitomicaceae bacterium]|tara:strand:+ start:7329 stop:8027 length:699 start_codon:yes stop_codon:yes gene_type:complete